MRDNLMDNLGASNNTKTITTTNIFINKFFVTLFLKYLQIFYLFKTRSETGKKGFLVVIFSFPFILLMWSVDF